MCGLHFCCVISGFDKKELLPLACILGAGIFAYSGYMLLQLQHLGLVCVYAWVPLGFWSIDKSGANGTWQPLWRLVMASALAFLAGYPPMWIVFSVCMLAYASFRNKFAWQTIVGTTIALVVSLFVCMVQLLPTLESTALKQMEPRYGAGIQNLDFYISYVIPNYFQLWIESPNRNQSWLRIPIPRRGSVVRPFLGFAPQ
jgi:hypothetical protein